MTRKKASKELDQHYVLTNITESTSKITGGTMWRLDWYCTNNAEKCQMDVDSTYRNFKRLGWEQFIQDSNWGVYTGIKRTQRQTARGLTVLTADRMPSPMEGGMCSQEMAQRLVAQIADAKSTINNFTDLFCEPEEGDSNE